MNISQNISSQVEKVEFSFFKSQEIHKISKLEINNPQIMDTRGDRPGHQPKGSGGRLQ